MTDCHCHLLPWFKEKGTESGRIFVNSTGKTDWEVCSRLNSEVFFPFYGIHPWMTATIDQETLSGFQHFLQNQDLYSKSSGNGFGIGEIGLDKTVKTPNQVDILKFQLEMANELQIPISLHCVKAWGKLFSLLDNPTGIPKVLLHNFNAPKEILDEAIRRQYYLSFSLRSLEQDQNFTLVPSDRIMLETDSEEKNCPDQQTYHFRLESVYAAASVRLGFTEEKLLEIIRSNAAVFTTTPDLRQRESR